MQSSWYICVFRNRKYGFRGLSWVYSTERALLTLGHPPLTRSWLVQVVPRVCMRFHSYRGLLTLYAGAVEAQSRDAVGAALDVKDALVISLSGLRLGQVLGQQGDGPHYPGGDIDLSGGQDLRTLLQKREKEEQTVWVETVKYSSGTPVWADKMFWEGKRSVSLSLSTSYTDPTLKLLLILINWN